MSNRVVSFILYGVLGALLSLAGAGIMEQPAYFVLIMAIVLAIDISNGIRRD